MKGLREYTIYTAQLTGGSYQYEYEITDTFFALVDSNLVQKGNLNVVVQVQPKSTGIIFDFDIKGEVELVCDISLETFNHPISTQPRWIAKYGEKEEEISEEITIIPESTAELNLATIIHEFIGMEIPYKKVHPKFQEEEATEEETVLRFTSDTENLPEEPTAEEPIDPRWAALKNIHLN